MEARAVGAAEVGAYEGRLYDARGWVVGLLGLGDKLARKLRSAMARR
jgi:hypothetical protein